MSAYDRLTMKTDEQVAEVIQRGGREEQNDALCCLRERHQAKLLRYVTNRLSGNYHLAEDVTQITWLHVFNYLRVNRIRTTFLGFLFEVAKRKCIDEIRKEKHEWHIEHDVPLPGNIEESEIEKEQQAVASHLPFVTSKLSDCQRTIWLLRSVMGLSTGASAKLLGKKKHTIDSTLSSAAKAWKKYCQSEDYDLYLACQEIKYFNRSIKNHSLILDCFSETIRPDIAPDQLKKVGLSMEIFNTSGVCLLLPFSFEVGRQPVISYPYLLLQLYNHSWNINSFGPSIFNQKVLVRAMIDDENVSLISACDAYITIEETSIDKNPNRNEELYISLHAPRLLAKASLSFIHDSKYDYSLLGIFPDLTPFSLQAQLGIQPPLRVFINPDFPKTGIAERIIRLNNKKLQ